MDISVESGKSNDQDYFSPQLGLKTIKAIGIVYTITDCKLAFTLLGLQAGRCQSLYENLGALESASRIQNLGALESASRIPKLELFRVLIAKRQDAPHFNTLWCIL